MIMNPVQFLHEISFEAIAAADPLKIIAGHLPADSSGRIIVIGAGKASAAMAKAVENSWPDKDIEGIVVTRYGYAMPCQKIEIVEAAHPIPDEAGQIACQKILDILKDVTENDLVLCLISGGGSALLSYPAPCLSLKEKQAINNALLRSGAPIHEMNIVRKHLSLIKGGQLALAASPAKICTLIISDVPGDDPATVASGPTLPDPSTQKQALEIIDKYNIPVTKDIRAYLMDQKNETPKPEDPRFANSECHIIAKAGDALEQAENYALKHGLDVINLGDDLEGEAKDLAQDHILKAMRVTKPTIFLSGGETTVTMNNATGKGGRNTEYMLAASLAAKGHKGIYGIAIDTDGIDGSEDNAGAYFTPDTLSSANALGVSASQYLEHHDSYSFFHNIEQLVITGPTYTNVNDFRAILVLPDNQ